MSSLETFTLVLLLIAIGWTLVRTKLLAEGAASTLNQLALHVFLPAAILLHVPKLGWTSDLSALVLVPWAIVLLGIVVALLASRWLRLDRGATACVMLGTTLGNTAFLGYPLVSALVAPDALGYAVVYDQFGTFPALASFGLFVIAWYGGGKRPTPANILRRIVGFPPFVALLVALVLMPDEPPTLVTQGLDLLAGALMPCVIIAIGMQLRFHCDAGDRAPLVLIVALKLLLFPAAVLVAAPWLGLRGELRDVAVLQTAMPTMITTGALLSLAGLRPRLAAAMVGCTTIIAIVTLPLWDWLLG